jgi:thiamine kinase-like enzyme
MSETPESVLADLPGWANATCSELTGGLTNHTWLVDAGERKAVLKIDEAPRSEPYNARRTEEQIQTRAAEQGLANRVLLATDTVYMTEYVEGVHALPLTGRTFNAIGAARDYARRIKSGDEAKVRECLQKIENGPRPPNLCCCHNDLVVGNIINTPETRLLDWEYACDNDPFFDLATIAAHHAMTDAQIITLLDAYFDGDGTRWREQLDRQADVYQALLWLWEQAGS